MNEVRLNPWTPESTATFPPGESGAIGALFNSFVNVQPHPTQEIQYFRSNNVNVIVLNSSRYQAPFRHLHKASLHDPELIRNLHDGLKKNEHVFLRSKFCCITEMTYWFSDIDLEKNLRKVVSSLYLKGLIGSKLRLEIEPFEDASKILAIDFKNGLVINLDLTLKTKAFLLILPFYLKLVSVAKRSFEMLSEDAPLQEKIRESLKSLKIDSFEQLKEVDVFNLPDLDNLFNQALKEDKSLYFSREMADDYELVDDDKKFKIPKGSKVIFPCATGEQPLCPGFQSGMLTLRVLFVFLLMKGKMVKETKNVWGSMYIPTTKTTYNFIAK